MEGRLISIPAHRSGDAAPGAGAWFAIAVLLALTIISYVERSIRALLIGSIEADLHNGDLG